MRAIIIGAALLAAGSASACPARRVSAPLVLADNAATSTPAPANGDPTRAPDTAAYPNSPNGSPATADKGAPVVTDKAACSGMGASACADSPKPSTAADTSDVVKATPTTVNGSAPKP